MKPILFNTEMVRAILDGRKTQTRRVVKPQPIITDELLGFREDNYKSKGFEDLNGLKAVFKPVGFVGELRIKSKYQPGDILWVRETWCNISKPECEPEYYYYADTKYAEDYDPTEWKWRPSIHMPRAAARLFLKVADVRAERLQEISEKDAKAEGVRSYFLHKEHGGEWHESNSVFLGADGNTHPTRIKAFAELWNSFNAKKGYPWDDNPWVWAYTFERVNDLPPITE